MKVVAVSKKKTIFMGHKDNWPSTSYHGDQQQSGQDSTTQLNKQSCTNNGESNRCENEAENKEILPPNPELMQSAKNTTAGQLSVPKNELEKVTLEEIMEEGQVDGSDSIKKSLELLIARQDMVTPLDTKGDAKIQESTKAYEGKYQKRVGKTWKKQAQNMEKSFENVHNHIRAKRTMQDIDESMVSLNASKENKQTASEVIFTISQSEGLCGDEGLRGRLD